jgi:hypothetical protein
VEQAYDETLFTDGLYELGKPWTDYTEWLNVTIPRDFHGLDPFDQRACLLHRQCSHVTICSASPTAHTCYRRHFRPARVRLSTLCC